MARCRKYSEKDCSNLYYCTSDGENSKADGRPMQKYCYYCLGTPHTKKIAHAAQWAGSTPKWCPLGRDQVQS